MTRSNRKAKHARKNSWANRVGGWVRDEKPVVGDHIGEKI